MGMGCAVRSLFAAVAGLAAFAAAATPAIAQDRYAVVIGAENYPDAIGPALGALADLDHVAGALESEGFMVERVPDPDEAALKRSLFWLVDRLDEAGEDAVGVFYFAGHGVQINGHTFLVPVDARTTDDLTLSGSSLPADLFTERLNGLDATTLIVLDAASPNGLIERFDLEPGLAPFDRPDGGLVIFSHYPDQLAITRQADVSVFARAFAHLVTSTQRDFNNAVQDLRREVSEESGGSRYAWVSGRLSPRFRLGAEDDAPVAAAPTGTRSLSPTPVPAEPMTETHSLAADAAGADAAEADDEIHLVQVFFGADRVVEQDRDGQYEFTSDSAPTLTYGTAEVSIPPHHQRGEMESPRWWKFEFSPDPEKHVVYRGAEVLDETTFFDELRDRVNASTHKQAFVFVHGFNTSFENAARRTAQMHHDLNFDGAPIFYSWPSQGSGSPMAYNRDGTAAQRTVPKLKRFLMMVKEETGAEEIHLIAHSMGNRALVDALDEIAEDIARDGEESPFTQVILSAPDIDRQVFLDMADQILPTAERVTLYASEHDQALKVSRQINGFPRAGDASDGIVIVDGLNTVDASEVKTELFDIGHDYFASQDSIIDDIRSLFDTNAEPDDRGLEERFLPPQDDEYWVIHGGLPGATPAE